MSGSAGQGQKSGRFLGSLKDALVAASREDTGRQEAAATERAAQAAAGEVIAVAGPSAAAQLPSPKDAPVLPSAAEAAREARSPRVAVDNRHIETDAPPTTRVVRAAKPAEPTQRTTLVRGKAQVARGAFEQDPVVG